MSQASSGATGNNVVSLNGLGRNRSPGQRILGESRDQLVSHLSLWLREVATPISEELFVLADSTRDRLLQTRYLDLRADIEKDWSHLLETFRRDLSAEAERCQNQDESKETPSAAALEMPDFDGLQLVADEDLSEHIVIREFAAQIAESCDEELYTLNRRVTALLGHDEPRENANPLAPSIVCRALSDACAAIGSNAEERLLLLRRLERHLHLGLPPIYQKINAYLIERGILPDLKRNYRKSTIFGEIKAPAATAQSSAGSGTAVGNAGALPPALAGEGILEALQRLGQARAAQTPAASQNASTGDTAPTASLPPAVTAGSGTPGVMIDAETVNRLLLASLNEIQHAPAALVEPDGQIINQIRRVRESDNAQHVDGLASVTIDIVAMLFDFIFDDTHIPVAIKALLSRLQIPVLKIAMLNPGFFADRQHATRRFLGSVSGISIRWGGTVDESDPFYAKLAELVERIQAEFENDIEIFGTALDELETFVSERENEENVTALTATHVVIQHEQESEARERAQRAVKAFCSEQPQPPLIDAFLGEKWLAVMQRIAVKHDADSDEWKKAKETMQTLAWSVEAKKQPADRLKLISVLPTLLGQLNKGLDSIGADQGQRTAFFDVLVKCHAAALKGEAQAAMPVPDVKPAPAPEELTPSFTPPSEGDLLVTRSMDHGVEVEEIILVGASPIWRADDREIFRQVSELKRGDWVEFRELSEISALTEAGKQHQGQFTTFRERLHWISPQRGILLFSNHRSAKAISITPEAMARQIRDGKATILHESEIFERALNGALESINAI
jgi:hypothetical protein